MGDNSMILCSAGFYFARVTAVTRSTAHHIKYKQRNATESPRYIPLRSLAA